MTTLPQEWIILRLRFGPQDLRINYEDSQSNKRRAPFGSLQSAADWAKQDVPVGPPQLSLQVWLPADFSQLIFDRLEHLPMQQSGPHNSGPVPLAIFIEPPPHTDNQWCENVVSNLFSSIDTTRIQFVWMPSDLRKRGSKRTAFNLPLRILTVSTTHGDALEQFRLAWWYKDNPEVQQHGIFIQTATKHSDYDPQKSESWHIVLTDTDSVDQIVSRARRLSLTLQPRLIVLVSPPDSEAYVKALRVPNGTAFLWVPQLETPITAESTKEFLKRFLYGIIHDYPLHEALKSATRLVTPQLPHPPALIADPATNTSLRLSDAIPQLMRKAEEIRPWKRLGNIDGFIARVGGKVSSPLQKILFDLDHSRSRLHRDLKLVRETPGLVVFDQETEGLVPLAKGTRALERANEEHQNISATAASIVNVPGFVEEMERYQERQVDIGIQHADSEPAFQSIDTLLPLRPKGRYRVRLHIGHRAPDSVMIGDIPPLDPLLSSPDDDGYHLEVALFEKDFVALSPTLQKLYLPRLSGSDYVYFTMRAPRRKGPAEARICIYQDNNLLQSFLLKANVNDSFLETEALKLKVFSLTGDNTEDQITGTWIDVESDKQVVTALAFSQSARFGNLGQMHRRELSIGFNEDADPASHTFMMKADGARQGIQIKDDILRQQTEGFRDILKSNVHNSKNQPIFESYPASGDESKQIFLSVIQQLIEKGAALYDFLFTKVPSEMKLQFGALKKTTDKTIQVVRYDLNNVFPWPILYDFQLPTKIAGADPPEICLGQDKSGATTTNGHYPVKKCSHGPNDEVYCIYGFWGLRHQIEQLFKSSNEKTDAITELVPASPKSVVRLAVSTGDAPATKLHNKLAQEIGTGFVNSTSSEDLIDLLWDDATRPAVLVVMGHMQQSTITGEPDEERIVLVPKKKWFLPSLIIKRVKKVNGTKWKQPNTLVMLMACSSGATEITTLNNFVTNLDSAGAAAIVGTECLVFSSLVGRFAQEVTSDLWNGKQLGEAVKFFNRRLVSTGNPLAFAFNCLGNADLKLVKPQ